jgi:photosystem II stability/assembly factor-like uncharacterized protein
MWSNYTFHTGPSFALLLLTVMTSAGATLAPTARYSTRHLMRTDEPARQFVDAAADASSEAKTAGDNMGRSRPECGPDSLTQSTNPDLIGDDSVWCGTLDFTSETSLARSFEAPYDLQLQCVTFGVRDNTGPDWTTRVRILEGPIDADYSALILLAEVTVPIPSGASHELFTAAIPALPLSAGSEFIVELNSPTRDPGEGGDGGRLAFGCNSLGQSAPTYIRADACDTPNFGDVADYGFGDRHLVLTLLGLGPIPTNGLEWRTQQLLPDANFYDIRDASQDYYDAHPDAEGFNSFRRWSILWGQRVESAEEPPGEFRYALSSIAANLACNVPVVCPPPSNPPSNWRPVGPFERSAEPLGPATANGVGIVIAFWVDPADSDHILLGAELGGLWKTTDGGATWTNLTDAARLPNVGVRDIAVDPNNNNVIYIVAGFGDFGLGVLKTTDGGATWNCTDLLYQVSLPIAIRGLRHHPTTSGTLYAATGDRILKTTNGGATWNTLLLQAPASTCLVSELTKKPGDLTTWYATTSPSGSIGARIFKIDAVSNSSMDITPTFSTVSPNTSGYLLAVTPFAPDSLYAYYITNAGAFITHTTNQGSNWSPPVQTAYPPIAGALRGGFVVSPTDPDVMYLAGIRVWKSTNGGASFLPVTNNFTFGAPNYAHDDCRIQVFLNGSTYGSGGNQDELIIGTDGGPYRTTDGGATWSDISGYGLNITKFYGLDVSYDHSIAFGGVQDMSSLRYDFNTGTWWNPARIGDGYECVIDPSDSSTLYVEGNAPTLFKSVDGGQTLFSITPPWPPLCTPTCNQIHCATEYIRPMVSDASSRVYIGHHDVWRTANGGTSWTQLSDFTANFGDSCYRGLFGLAASPSGQRLYAAYPNTLWCQNEAGGQCSGCCRPDKMIFRSADGGASWADISQGTTPATDLVGIQWAGISHIEIDPDNPDRVWVSFKDYWNGFRVWHSPNGGTDWFNVSQGLPNSPVHDLVYQRCSDDHLYAATDQGVYFWDSVIGQWVCWNDNLPIAVIWDLEINEATGTIYAATHGRGLWEADLVPAGEPCGCRHAPNGMVLWLTMDEPSGTTAFNSVGGNAGTHAYGPTPAAGEVSTARFYDAPQGQYTVVPWYPAIELGSSDFTIDGWIKRTSSVDADGLRTIMDKRRLIGPAVTTGYHVFMIDGELGLQLATAGPGTNFYGGAAAHIPLNAWHHFAVTVDRDSAQGVRFYIDGVLAGAPQDPRTHQGPLNNTVPFTIGSWTGGGGAYLQGGLDELEVFSRALSDAEVSALYYAGSSGKCRLTCHVPSNINFCTNESSRTVTTYLCNSGFVPRSMTYWFQGMVGGPGCNVSGVTSFTPSGPTTVTVPGRTCLPITVTIQRPASFTANGQTACYVMLVENNDSPAPEVFSSRGTLTSISPCGFFPVECCTALQALQAVEIGPVTVTNETPLPMDLPYQFRVTHADGTPDETIVSLDGLAPGIPAGGGIALAPGASAELYVMVELQIDNPLDFLTLVLEADPDGDGTFEPITSTFIRGEIPEYDICSADFDGNGIVDLTDYLAFQACFAGPNVSGPPECDCADFDFDVDADLRDFATFQRLFGETP